MDKYQPLDIVGEGSYGMVTKCRNAETGQVVAVKKFLETEEDAAVRKIALREIKLLKQLRHENLVNLLEVFKKKKHWYLVFEFVDHTVLDDLEAFPKGLDYNRVRKYLFQIIRGTAFCHSQNIIHRDIKPENILVSQSGVVKLCDFGFARTLTASGEAYTSYVATRWYRAPELLVGDTKYGKAVDVWAIGCLITEMLTGQALFPGDSDIDQLYHITRCLGNLIPKHQELFNKNSLFAGMRLPEVKEAESLDKQYPKLSAAALDLAKTCLQIDPDKRPPCAELLECDFFNNDGFAERFAQELKLKIQKENRDHQFQKKSKFSKRDKDDISEERKMFGVQDFSIDLKNRDTKLLKVKRSKAAAEKTDRLSNLSSLYDSAINQFKISPQISLKDSSSSLDYAKNTGVVIPPIHQNLSPTAMRMRPVPGNLNYRLDDKSKKYYPLLKQRKHSPAGHYSVSLTPVTNDKNVLQASRKKWEFSKTDVHLPELKHLPELRGVEARHSRFLKKGCKMVSECRVPSLAAIELHNTSLTLQQMSGTLMPNASEASFPRVEH
ncbi:cyclin-dependent kinase-like 2 [Cuculus canorus]|uniref:cyclin-dependent kinase-like 2 n=1 Tax=Cuculus canorus TaxID=55661 RepID=UPI0023AA4181|nr:cyclin-dependent kinase-like 2 [Cuculus canorus]XP_053920524.1 cyclin-dependent kinase-like 2 [Cuculus canorus]XP_053920525.1 cyclin-dependent kinase-like 2 [Cuculus canorus]